MPDIIKEKREFTPYEEQSINNFVFGGLHKIVVNDKSFTEPCLFTESILKDMLATLVCKNNNSK